MKRAFFKREESEIQEEDPEILQNIVCKSAKTQLKETIEHLKNADDLVQQYNILLTTDKGYITESLSQNEILETLDISSKTKKMDLSLKYGPYYSDFSKDGRYLLIGGERGQLSMMDWKTKDLSYDFNVKERIRAIKYLHKETMMAVSQKDYTFIYDNEGKELHCLRQIYQANYLEYLPYHFLLVAGTKKGFLNYLDTSIGTMVATIPSFHGDINMMCQNRSNAIISTGHSTGTVCMWSPNEKAPVMKMLCHDTSLRNIAIDYQGNYLVTSGQDRKLKVWDLRMTQNELADLRLGDTISHLEFSQTGLLGVAAGNKIHVLKDVHIGCQSMNVSSSLSEALSKSSVNGPIKNVRPLLSHSFNGTINSISFCPYEDILGVGLSNGFSTMFAPGSGEPNFDAFEANPYAGKKFRNEQEVKRLLEKIPSELIHIESMVSSVHLPSVAEEWENDKNKLFGEKPTLVLKRKRNSKSKPKPKTQKEVNTKDNLYYERTVLQKKLHETENNSYKKKHKLSRTPINSVLDKLIYNE